MGHFFFDEVAWDWVGWVSGCAGVRALVRASVWSGVVVCAVWFSKMKLEEERWMGMCVKQRRMRCGGGSVEESE